MAPVLRTIPIEELAEDAFNKAERVRMLEAMNTPLDFEARKKAFVQMALARKAAIEAENLLTTVIEKRPAHGQSSP